jgi:hypothetical protein
MTDNVIASALKFAARAIEKAKANRESCEAEINGTLGALRYVRAAMKREGDHMGVQFELVDPTNHVEALADPNLTKAEFDEKAQCVLDALEVLGSLPPAPG